MGNLGYGAFPTHPGEVLKDEIMERGISQRQLADRMGLTYSVVNEILNGHRPLTAKTALMFEAVLDVPADSLMIRGQSPSRAIASARGSKAGPYTVSSKVRCFFSPASVY